MPGRCFVAIDLPEPVVTSLTRASTAFLESSPQWAGEKWVAPELLHVTVAFFGTVPDPALPALIDGLARSCARHEPFGLRLSGGRAVPSRHHATMVWALLDGDVEAAASLQADIVEAAGCDADSRPYRPHITLVRSRRPRRVHGVVIDDLSKRLEAAGKGTDGCVSVRSVTVLASTLGATGPTYRALATIPLAGGHVRTD